MRGVDNDESLLAEVDYDLEWSTHDRAQTNLPNDDYILGAQLRDTITNEMWNHYEE